MQIKYAFIGALASVALAAAPVTSASAHGYRHGGLIFGLGALGAAVVVGAATIATAPFRVLAGTPGYYGPPRAAYYGPGYYAPAPQYYAPPPPAYYAPAPGYYAAPPSYYGR